MANNTLSTFIENTRVSFGPLTSELVCSVQAQLLQLTATSTSEHWLRALQEESPSSKELYRDPEHGFLLLAHSEPTGLYRPPHDHGDAWVVYALQRGAMEISTYARVKEADGHVRLVKRDVTTLRAGEARIYLPSDIHDTRCVNGPSLLFRFTERDLKQEDKRGRLTRYVSHNGVWTTGGPA
jgi:hypothetical protein